MGIQAPALKRMAMAAICKVMKMEITITTTQQHRTNPKTTYKLLKTISITINVPPPLSLQMLKVVREVAIIIILIKKKR